jgi:hypothetical protein
VPVIRFAISDSEEYRSPRYSNPLSKTITWWTSPCHVRDNQVPDFNVTGAASTLPEPLADKSLFRSDLLIVPNAVS